MFLNNSVVDSQLILFYYYSSAKQYTKGKRILYWNTVAGKVSTIHKICTKHEHSPPLPTILMAKEKRRKCDAGTRDYP